MIVPPGDWNPVTTGESGATVLRDTTGSRYAKHVPASGREELAAERDRVGWLAGTGVPGPRVLDWAEDHTGACLVTSAVPGVPADTVPPESLATAWPSIADTVRHLHSLSTVDCPFRRDLALMFPLARDVVARDAVEPDFLPVEQQDTPPAELLARLEPQLDRRLAEEPADTVVCHGDLCLPNIVLDPGTLEVSGLIDLGRLGLADRHADLALLLANSRETWPDETRARAADAVFAERYGRRPDPDRLRFYLHLDPLTWG
ncbi:APH(3'') family aminoglycoside O-phosphotransferase [Prauserella flavalba]|uniref:APH(3'') family aminoglycoside O-phosphotransferase n=1 Tax=Prauserella flavalba TaxID=1477506 RepID=A0A318LPV1_9PSEU|nr:APH(3'') family aminoglycoside O-phosphotransferase [Prauserella flavalba]PXY35384.1 APH(3'') family aminoglycoside O-phosphotransferase [Prauserella flavalba]